MMVITIQVTRTLYHFS